jgi:hypothetical protein
MKWGMTRVILLVSSHDLVASDVCPGGGIQMSSLPALPLITQNTLPGEGWVLGVWKTGHTIPLYNSWRPGLHAIAKLPAGSTATALEGLNVVHRPDVIIATKPNPEMNIKTGTTILRCFEYGEGEADLWIDGCWYEDSVVAVRNTDGSGFSEYDARETRHGWKTWWFKLRLQDGTVGWSNAFFSLAPYQPTAEKHNLSRKHHSD